MVYEMLMFVAGAVFSYLLMCYIMEIRYPMSSRRKVCLAIWDPSTEPNCYGRVAVNMNKAVKFLDEQNSKAKEGEAKLTITHLVGKATAMAIAKVPSVNGRIHFGTFIPNSTVDISFLVAIGKGQDLGKVLVRSCENKTIHDISKELHARANVVREGKCASQNALQPIAKLLPTPVIKYLLRIAGFLGTGCGFTPNPFGTAVITNIGVFGMEEAFAAPTPFARCPIYLAVGCLTDKPAVEEGQIVVQKQLVLSATMDHRFLDGAQAAIIAKTVKDIMEDPAKHIC